MKNVVSAGQYKLTIKGSNRPFGNDFVQTEAEIVQYEGQDEISAYVLCDKNSREPGRIYKCAYSLDGVLQACNTVN